MPFGRKQHGRAPTTGRSAHDDASRTQHKTATPENFTGGMVGGNCLSVAQHPFMPDLPPGQGELFFECTLFLYSVLALFLQYLNLYKTMWWLPNSYTHYAVKFYLIDPYLLSCVGLILGRRVTWCFMKKITIIPPGEEDKAPNYVVAIEWLLKLPMIVAVISSFMFSFLRVVNSYEFSSLLYLCRRLFAFVYNRLFPNYTTRQHYVASTRPGMILFCNELLSSRGTKAGSLLNLEMVGHACTHSPSHIRDEVNLLVLDLSQRCKQSFFSAFATAYFAVYVPCCFTPATLHVDYWWLAETVGVVFLTSLSLYLAFLLPLQYCDLLHRAAAHLGSWEKLDKSASFSVVAHPSWLESSMWSDGQVVKYGRSLYRGQGSMIAAEPGNSEHTRFYRLSSDPLRLLNTLCMMEVVLIFCQFLMLVHSTDWQHIVTLVLLMFTNYLLLFKLFKDKVILGRIYHPSPEDEATIARQQ